MVELFKICALRFEAGIANAIWQYNTQNTYILHVFSIFTFRPHKKRKTIRLKHQRVVRLYTEDQI